MGSEVVKFVSAAGVAWWLIPSHGTFGAAIGITAAMIISAVLKIASARALVRPVGLAPFGAMMLIFAALGLLRWLGDAGSAGASWLKYMPLAMLPIWLVMALALRLLLPAEIMRWIGIFARTIVPARH
jgi:hypothetical protein